MNKNKKKPAKSFMQKNRWIIIPGILIMGSVIFVQIRNYTRARWHEKDLKDMTDRCMQDAREMAIRYPELTKDYCSCSTKQIQEKFTKAEYIEVLHHSAEEQSKILLPVFQPCLDEYQAKIKTQ